jgi:hypothetical protein
MPPHSVSSTLVVSPSVRLFLAQHRQSTAHRPQNKQIRTATRVFVNEKKAYTRACGANNGEDAPLIEGGLSKDSLVCIVFLRGASGCIGSNIERKATQRHSVAVRGTRALNRLPFLGPIFAVGWPLDDPGGPRNQLKKSQKAGGSA